MHMFILQVYNLSSLQLYGHSSVRITASRQSENTSYLPVSSNFFHAEMIKNYRCIFQKLYTDTTQFR